jgi:hypothetical protein
MNMKAKTGFALGLAAVSMALLGAPASAHDSGQKRECSVEMLRGLYLFKGSGFQPINGAAIPKAIIETIRFNGDGTLLAETVTVTILGQSPHVAKPASAGHYTVEPDCTATITFDDGPAFNGFVASPLQVSLIQTGPAPAVLQGDARFVSR